MPGPQRTRPRGTPLLVGLRRGGGLVVVAGVAVLLALTVLRSKASSPEEDPAPPPAVQVLGDPGAPVTIVEYGDFKCPVCTLFHVQTEPDLIHQYVETGKARLVWRSFPVIDDESPRAAAAAWCAGRQGRFWAYHDALYDFLWDTYYGQRINVEGRPAYQGHYRDLADRVGGLDLATWTTCLESRAATDAVAGDRQLGEDQGVQGTPTFFINGRKVVGAQPFSVFAQLIDRELKQR